MFRNLFYQSIRPYLTTQPIHWMLNPTTTNPLFGVKPLSTLVFKNPQLKQRFVQVDVNERIVEIPFIFQHITRSKSRILDIGCCESTVSISLATLGHQVTGVDIRPYELSHPNFEFRQEDIVSTPLKEKQFDYVLLLSTVEHIGLDTMYGDSQQGTDDLATLRKVKTLLKPNGKLLLTVPYAKHFSQDSFMRRYDKAHLKRLLKGFKIIEQKFFAPDAKRSFWSEVTDREVPDFPRFGVVCVVATPV